MKHSQLYSVTFFCVKL